MTSVLRWKQATRLAIADCGGLDAASGACGLSSSQLSRCQIATSPDTLSLFSALALAEYSGTAAFAQCFADLAGCRLVPLGDNGGPDDERASATVLADCLSEAMEVGHVIAQALGDGRVTPAEQQAIQRAMADYDGVAQQLRQRFGPPIRNRRAR